jgi:protease II
MNNFVFSQDPILYSSTIPQQPQNESDIKRQLDTIMAQYQALQQKQQPTPPTPQTPVVDYLGELDDLLKNTDPDILNVLSENTEFAQLNNMIQQDIQAAIMKEVKWKINSNQESIKSINRIKEMIDSAKHERDNEDKKNMSELTDYIKNYSDMTFNEYKRLKNKT